MVKNNNSGTNGTNGDHGLPKKRSVGPPMGAEEIFFAMCERFLDPNHSRTTDEVSLWAKAEMTRRGKSVKINRQHVYAVVQWAISEGYVRFCPPLSDRLSRRIADRSGVAEENITVADVVESEHVASASADQTIKLIKRVVAIKGEHGTSDGTVHLGLGAGRTTMLVAKHLGRVLRSMDPISGLKGLVIHAISSAYLADEPVEAPGATYFADLREANVPVRFVPLLAEPMVPCSQFGALKKRPGIKQAFKQKGEIDIVITSLAGRDHKFGMLNRLEEVYQKEYGRPAEIPHRVGDVQFRGFDEHGPVKDAKDAFRAVTLFEIHEYCAMVKKPGKFLLLVSGPTFRGDSRVDALETLFTVPKLRVWSHVCMDIGNARELFPRLTPQSSDMEPATTE